MELTAGVAATSTAISALPGDAATPIAEQVSELTSPLLIVVCAIYLEKFLLTTIGYVSFKFLIPFACLLGAVYLFSSREAVRVLAVKLGVFAMAISSSTLPYFLHQQESISHDTNQMNCMDKVLTFFSSAP